MSAPTVLPITSKATANAIAAISATTGAYRECVPFESSTGTSLPPRNAPASSPASESPLQTNPCTAPPSAASSTRPSATQSTTVTRGLG